MATEKQGDDSLANDSNPVKKSLKDFLHNQVNKLVGGGLSQVVSG